MTVGPEARSARANAPLAARGAPPDVEPGRDVAMLCARPR
jgi:hypothetical protein